MTQLKLVVIVGSVREGRRGPLIGDWFVEQAAQHGRFEVEVVDLADVPLPLVMPPQPPAMAEPERPAGLAAVTEVLAAADAFVVVTPEYNHSFPASLKAFVDWHWSQWRAKPIGFVSYGSAGGGLRAVEQLRSVFAELHATTVRDQVSFHRYWLEFDDNGRPVDAETHTGDAKLMLDQLTWWGTALRDARTVTPYAV
ncbi:NADPH-dependent FMN reductase [Kibdelosporangium persicum]|uniref:NADPH-dependent FMN ketoreductase n=1 Tax=Kibdelosporangium persicum TaxID=2698649 RepID=A0ABX2F686_9PSEU|nr:NAD(P)H-dependent oxidoreductase [Kibdelosporangium persicum]NRN66328.1 NADPH-dependent FMN ketoreductase [Kibdelosporangium persicum]